CPQAPLSNPLVELRSSPPLNHHQHVYMSIPCLGEILLWRIPLQDQIFPSLVFHGQYRRNTSAFGNVSQRQVMSGLTTHAGPYWRLSPPLLTQRVSQKAPARQKAFETVNEHPRAKHILCRWRTAAAEQVPAKEGEDDSGVEKFF